MMTFCPCGDSSDCCAGLGYPSMLFATASMHRQRPDLHVADFDCSRAVLQGDPAFIEHSVPHFGCFLSVEPDRDVAPLRRDLERIPFAAGFRHEIDLDVACDRASAVTRIGALVKDICFV